MTGHENNSNEQSQIVWDTYGLARGELLDGEGFEVLNGSIYVADGLSSRDVSKVLDSVKSHRLVTRVVYNRDRVGDLMSIRYEMQCSH